MKSPSSQFVQQVLITVGIILFTVLFLLLFYFILDIILLIFAAVLLAVFLRGLADVLNKYTRLPESFSVMLVAVLILGILAGAIALLAPDVAEQYRHLRAELPKSLNKVSNYIAQFGWGRAFLEQMPNSGKLFEKLSNIDYSLLLTQVGGYFSSTVGAIGNFFIVILVAVYLAIEPKFYTNGLTKLFPVSARPRIQEIFAEIGNTLRWWLIGKILSMLFIGILTWIGLSILGVPLALTLGLIAGLLSFIPNFGPIFSAVPAILLAFVDSPIKALYVLVLFVFVQIIESNLVTPFIERRTIELPAALTILSQIALGVMLGGLGLVLATPLLAVIIVLIQMVYVQDVLGDKDTENRKNTLVETEESEKKSSE